MKAIFEKMWPGKALPRPKEDLFLNPADKLCPLKAGDELFIDAPDAEMNEDLKFRFGVAFNEPGVVEAKSVYETLKHFGELVSSTVDGFRSCLA